MENLKLTDEQFATIARTIGEKLRKKRKELGLSILELSMQSGISDSHISLIENAKKHKISLNIYLRLAACLGIKPSEIFNELDNLPPFNNFKDR